MNAKSSDAFRVQEIKTIIEKTMRQIEVLGINEQRFLNPLNDADDLIMEGILNRVFRLTEELGRISDSVADQYGFDTPGARGIRNRLAHVYGSVSRDLIWGVLTDELSPILAACNNYLDDNGIIDLELT